MLAGLPFIMNAWQGAQWTTRETNESATRIPLTDDSTIQLYQHSEVRFRDFLGRPEAELLRGGARFKVERNDLRRFRVRSGHTTITALGTEFNVLRLNGRTGVYVINGVVRVQSDRALADLTPGAAVSFSENGQMEVLQPEATMTNGFLTASVRIIAAELNRRQRLPRIVVEGPVAAGRRFTSSFSLDQPEHWVQALERDPSLEIVRRGNVVIVRERRSER
jgi:transmembrane sensor